MNGHNDEKDYELVLKNRVQEKRREKSISQEELARIIGVSRNTVSNIETEQYTPTAKLALLICTALGTKFEDLFYLG